MGHAAVPTVRPGAPLASEAERRRTRRRVRLRRRGLILLLLSPWLIGFGAFYVYPMLASLYYSFTRFDGISPPQWAGTFNYRFMFTKDPLFWKSMYNTAWMIVLGVPLRIMFAIATAIILTRPRWGIRVHRTFFYLPAMVPPVAATLGFVYMFNPTGPINQLLGLLHLPQPLWFYDPTWSKPALLMLGLWGIGDAMIIFLAGLLNVPLQLYEAADIEGANALEKFRYVTLPMISPVIFFSVVIGVISGFQYFTQGYVASSVASGANEASTQALGAPQNSLLFYPIWLFEQGFRAFHMGYASAMAWVLFLIVMACTIVLIRTSNRWVYYQGGFR